METNASQGNATKSGIYVYTYAPRKWQNHDILCQPEMTLFATTNANLPVLFLAASPDSLLLVKEFLFQACQVPSANFSFALRNTHINMWITWPFMNRQTIVFNCSSCVRISAPFGGSGGWLKLCFCIFFTGGWSGWLYDSLLGIIYGL